MDALTKSELDDIKAEVDGALECVTRYHEELKARLRSCQEAVNRRIGYPHCAGCGTGHWAIGKCPGFEPTELGTVGQFKRY